MFILISLKLQKLEKGIKTIKIQIEECLLLSSCLGDDLDYLRGKQDVDQASVSSLPIYFQYS